ncbi:hypothetical protein GVAV_001538 [Gurleya vavrai]
MPHNSLYILQTKEILPFGKLAIFDLDDTLIKYQPSYSKRPLQLLYPNTISKLQEISKTHSIVIFSNQNNTITDLNREFFNNKIKQIFDLANVPILFIAALDKDYYRKPSIGMYDYVSKLINIDLSESFMVGDAAGRNNDHSDCDFKLAVNLGIRFYTPEEFFKDEILNIKMIYYCTGDIEKRNKIQKILNEIVRPENKINVLENDKKIDFYEKEKKKFEMENKVSDKVDSNEFKNKIRKVHFDCLEKNEIKDDKDTAFDLLNQNINNICENNMIIQKISDETINQTIIDKIDILKNKKLIFLYGDGKLSGKSYFCKLYFKDFKIIRNSKDFNSNEKIIFINCTDKFFIKKHIENDFSCIYLNYSEFVLNYLKSFTKLINRNSQITKKIKFSDYSILFKKIFKCEFFYDKSEMTENELEISELIV